MRLSTPDVEIDLPAGWEVGAVAGTNALAHGPVGHDDPRPTITLTSEDGARSLGDETRRAIEQLQQVLPTATVVGVDSWDAQIDGDSGAPGRQLTFTVGLDEGRQATLTQWLWRAGDRLVTLTAATSTADTLVRARSLHNIAVGARLRGGAGDHPRVEPLESLSWITDRQRSDGDLRFVPQGALDDLAEADDAGRAAALRTLGLLGEDGPTEFGDAVMRSHLAEAVSVRVRAWHRRARSEIRFTPLDRGHVVEAGPPVHRLIEEDPGPWAPGLVGLAAASFATAPARAFVWMGLTPSWALHHEPVRLQRRHLDHHVRVEAVPPPPGLDEVALTLWRQPWTHTVAEVGPRHGAPTLAVELVAAGRLGLYGVEDDGDHVLLTPVRVVTAYHRLLQAFGIPVPADTQDP